MTPDAYYYIAVAYASIAVLTSVGLVVRRFKKQFKHPGFIEYVLHGLHIPPYMIAAYWYWDGYEYMMQNYDRPFPAPDNSTLVNTTNSSLMLS